MPRIVIERGRTIPFDELPARTIALDGYVQGPHVDPERERYSFDHHAGCIRHATLSSCEMALDAVRVGLDPVGLTIVVNDLDPDSVLAAWLLLRPAAAHHDAVAAAVRAAGRLDALGPAVGGPGLVPALGWALEPVLTANRDGRVRRLGVDGLHELFDACVVRLDGWVAAGAPAEHAAMVPAAAAPCTVELLHQGEGWCLARSSGVFSAFADACARGFRAAVIARPLADGTSEYTVGKASEFVRGFDVPAILAALLDAEQRANPAQVRAYSWGGGSTIGGSPRNADGSGSRLGWQAVVAVVERARR
jgi:hypothetical protein